MGYSSGKNSSSLKTPPVHADRRIRPRTNMISLHDVPTRLSHRSHNKMQWQGGVELTFIWRRVGTGNSHVEMSEIVIFRSSGDTGRRVGHETFSLLSDGMGKVYELTKQGNQIYNARDSIVTRVDSVIRQSNDTIDGNRPSIPWGYVWVKTYRKATRTGVAERKTQLVSSHSGIDISGVDVQCMFFLSNVLESMI